MGEGEHQAKDTLKPRTVLVADDSVTIRRVVELCFLDTDIRVVSASSGSEALQKIAEEDPDVVIADVVMSDPDGYEIADLVKASSRPVPVLLLAGTFEPFDGDRARESGADGCLVKPFDSRTLLDVVQRLLSKTPERRPVAARAASPEGDREPRPVPSSDVIVDPIEPLDAAVDLEPEAPHPAGSAIGPENVRMEPEATPPSPTGPEAAPQPSDHEPALSQRDIDAIARAVVKRLSDDVVREIAWDVVPDLAERIVRQRIRELEHEEDEVR